MTKLPNGKTKGETIVELFLAGVDDFALLAMATQSTRKSVEQTLWRNKLIGHDHPKRAPKWRSTDYMSRGGFKIPAERRDEYRALRKLGLTQKECGWEMGLLARPEPGATGGKSPRGRAGNGRKTDA